MPDIPKSYNPENVETKWYSFWEDKGYFHQEIDKTKEVFSIVMPPPNVTGSLHLGHALDNTLQDILTRFYRMRGYNTLWLPGTDHAGIATQARVEEELAKEGLTKEDLGREGFLKRVWQWKEEYGGRITRQLRLLGASCDWQRERFTLDEGCSRAVRRAFYDLYQKGLIYRGNYIINWCPKCHTTISDIEVEHWDEKGNLYYIRYPLLEEKGEIIVATTRPETMLGDTAVAVNPEDERYRNLIGKKVVLPLLNRIIPIIADSYVDPQFGTGAVKITPAHDPNDFEIGQRHNLKLIGVIDEKGKMTSSAGEKYEGLDRFEARKKVVEDLKQGNFLLKTEDYTHAVGHCYRCNTVIEPLVSMQWFVKMEPLAKPALDAARKGEVRFIPERFTHIYENWLENIKDWCISRQLWWGHRIPVWYCRTCGNEICALEDPHFCPRCQSENLEQDPDVLDTWFSSALWPFSTLGWPEDTPELEHFYPTSVLVTGRDIIFFWVARMIFMALAETEKVPFYKVLIHGLVLDRLGRKMSKSLGNGVDPIEVINSYGADSLRFMLVTGNSPGNDLRFQEERVEASRNFCNKIWNAARFVLMNLEDIEEIAAESELADLWIKSQCQRLILEVTEDIQNYEIGEAARKIYNFLWSDFCDWYVEIAKMRIYGEDKGARKTAQQVLVEVLEKTLLLLHPFMPFITEEIWQKIPQRKDESIMIASWPLFEEKYISTTSEKAMEEIREAIRLLRNIRAEINIPPSKEIDPIIIAEDDTTFYSLQQGKSYIETLARCQTLKITMNPVTPSLKTAAAAMAGARIFVPLEGLIDMEEEAKKLKKEISRLEKDLQKTRSKLADLDFRNKAPREVVLKEENKAQEFQIKIETFKERLKFLEG